MREQILYYALRYHGDYKQIERALKYDEAWEHIVYDGAYITIQDEDYPKKLRRLQYAPWILFYEGDITLLKRSACGIVGSRDASVFGMNTCAYLVHKLRERYVIVSGLARGIDAMAHRSALQSGTIGVIGCGLQVIYPPQNADLYKQMRKHHLLISEYPADTKPYAYHFPWRNRLIAALSDALIVVEAKKRSGSLLSVNEALEIDIPVYCIPHNFGNKEGEGCNFLISQGANILVEDEDIALI